MMKIAELEDRIKALEDRVNHMLRIGLVTSTDPKEGTVRVKLVDSDELVSYDLRVLFPKTHDDKFYCMPDVDEHVICLFLPFGLEQGFVVGAFYSKKDPVPVVSQDKRHVLFKDGAFFEYDRAAHHGIIDLTACDGVFEIKTGTTHVRIEPHHIYLRADRIDENDDR